MCAASIEQLIDRRIDKWSAIKLPHADDKEKPRRPVVTISRDLGSGGMLVAEMLAAEMELVLFDKEIINSVAGQAHISSKIVATLDEHHRSAVDSWVEGILKARIFDRSEYANHLLKVMKSLAVRGGCVILGRGANFVLQNEPGVYHFRIVADEEVCISRIANRLGISHEAAAKMVTQTKIDRKKFLKETFRGANVDNPLSYHMIFNSGRINIDDITRLIREYVESSERRRTAV